MTRLVCVPIFTTVVLILSLLLPYQNFELHIYLFFVRNYGQRPKRETNECKKLLIYHEATR